MAFVQCYKKEIFLYTLLLVFVNTMIKLFEIHTYN